MNWTRGVLYLCVVVLLYWWGVRVLLKVPSRHGGDRELDAVLRAVWVRATGI